jgi:chitosanase
MLTPFQKRRADQLISVFENETLELQYGYIDNLHDGRGYTAGRAGFCTAEGDLLEVVERFPVDFKKLLPTLRNLAKYKSGSTHFLGGLPAAWKHACLNQIFKDAQDFVSDKLYYYPAMVHADRHGFQYDLTKVAIYEAIIQHGDGDDHDSLGGLIKRSGPVSDEKTWLKKFMEVRRETLIYPHDPDTRDEWQKSVGRANSMISLLNNMYFTGPITVNPFGTEFTIL